MQKAQIMFGISATIIPLQNIFLRFSHGPVEQLAPVCKYVVKLRFPLICFHCKVWQILRGTNALCFQLLTLIPAHWLWIGSIVPPFQTIFQSSPYLFDQFAENLSTKCLSFKKDYKLLDYDQSPLFDLIKSFLHSRSLIAYGLGAHSKNHFYLENCPAFNGSPVTWWTGLSKG